MQAFYESRLKDRLMKTKAFGSGEVPVFIIRTLEKTSYACTVLQTVRYLMWLCCNKPEGNVILSHSSPSWGPPHVFNYISHYSQSTLQLIGYVDWVMEAVVD